MNKDTKQLIIAVVLALLVVGSIIAGIYAMHSEPEPKDPCENIKGCEYYQCQADRSQLYNRINMYLLQKQNCLLEEIKNEK